jgi:hypothetical protein
MFLITAESESFKNENIPNIIIRQPAQKDNAIMLNFSEIPVSF